MEIRIYDSRSDLFDYLTKYTCRYLIDYGALIVGKHTYGIPQLIDYDHGGQVIIGDYCSFLLYTSDAADEEDSVDLGVRRIIKKK